MEEGLTIEQIIELAEAGDAEAQFSLGVRYGFGWGVPKDNAESVKWYRMAAEQGFLDAQYNLGMCYASGNGVAVDHEEAVRWFRPAAENGHPDAQKCLDWFWGR